MLSIAFDRAIVLGIAKKNPSRMIGNIKSKKTKVDFWTLEEFQKVISLLYKGDYYEHYLFMSFWLLFMTGMRIGEAAALHLSLIHILQKKNMLWHLSLWQKNNITGRFSLMDLGRTPYRKGLWQL